MDGLTLRNVLIPSTDVEASLAFYRDALGLTIENDVAYGEGRWVTLTGPTLGTAVVVYALAGDPDNAADRETLERLLAKGLLATYVFQVPDVDAAFATIEATGADVVQEPMDPGYGTRDCAFRDPAGNHIRIQQAA